MGEIVVLLYVDDCVYWYTSEALRKWFVETLVNILHVKFLGFANWIMSIRIPQMKDYSMLVYQFRYSTYIVDNYLDTVTVKISTKFYNTTFSSDMTFIKDYVSTSDEKF